MLREQLKPNLAVFILCGVDGLFDFLLPIVNIVVTYVCPSVHYAISSHAIRTASITTLSDAQPLNKLWNVIRNEMFGCRTMCTKHSKVIVLNRKE